MQPEENITKLKIDLLIPNAKQPRKKFNNETLEELASSIKEYGILNPILVRKKDNLYEIIAGERRYRAAKIAGLNEVPVIIKNIDDTKSAEIALIENLQREDISPIEEAKSYQEILDISKITEENLSKIVGKSQSYISNKLRLLKLPQNIQDALIGKKISEHHARSLISVTDPEKQTELLNKVIDEKLTVKELENIINDKNITENEIQSAINDIMKSLNISNKEKEEKESDTMNNGSFFTTPLNNPNNDTSNNMTPPTMESPQPAESQQTPGIPSFELPGAAPEPIPTFTPPVAEPPVPEQTPEVSPIPTLDIPQPIPAETPTIEVPNPLPSFDSPMAPQMVPPMAPEPIPTFTPPVAEPPVPEPTPAIENNFTAPIIDPPLFATPAAPTETPAVEAPLPTPAPAVPTFDVPVEAPTQDEVTKVETLLNSNGINYKKYSNETGHCIIIELK